MLVQSSARKLQTVRWEADAVATAGADPSVADATPLAAFNALRAVQKKLAALPPSIREPMRWLVLVMVADRPHCHTLLRGMLAALPDDFSVHHFDARSMNDSAYGAYAREPWYSTTARIVHRGFRVGSGCILESLKLTIQWMLTKKQPFTHLWKIDSDLDFGTRLDVGAHAPVRACIDDCLSHHLPQVSSTTMLFEPLLHIVHLSSASQPSYQLGKVPAMP